MAEADFRLKTYRGDTLDLELALWADDDATVPYRLDDATAVLSQIREFPDNPVLVTLTGEVVDTNRVRVAGSAGDMALLDPGTVYQFDVEVHHANGHVHTVAYGLLDVVADITRSA